jgi:hypothetical protein
VSKEAWIFNEVGATTWIGADVVRKRRRLIDRTQQLHEVDELGSMENTQGSNEDSNGYVDR